MTTTITSTNFLDMGAARLERVEDVAETMAGLCEILFGMLNPDGRLLIANFLPDITNAGYMEAFMDWWLIYRTEAELYRLAETLPAEQVEMINLFSEENKNIAFLEVSRKGSEQ